MVTTPNYDLDVDTTLGGNNASDYIIPSQKAIKAYVDNNTGSTVDQTFDPTSQAAQSGVAIQGELSTNYQSKLVSGTNIKTINNTSLLGSGNIDTSEIFIAQYDSTTYNEILTAYNAGKEIICRDSGVFFILSGINLNNNVFAFSNNTSTQHILKTISNNIWTTSVTNIAKSDLSNVSSISSSSAVYTALGNKQDTLVSGTNIKTINNTSLLGSGNLSLANTTLSNVLSIDNSSAVATALNGKADTDLSNLSATGETKIDNNVLAILDTLYPIGAIYIGTMSICPLETLGIGTWQLVSVGKVLQGAGSGFEYIAGASVSASLPTLTAVSNGDHSHNRGTMNISGGPITVGRFASSQNNTSGALNAKSGTSRGTGYYGSTTSYDANLTLTASSNWSGSTNTTGAHTHDVEWSGHVGTTVQPDAYVVNIWERTA